MDLKNNKVLLSLLLCISSLLIAGFIGILAVILGAQERYGDSYQLGWFVIAVALSALPWVKAAYAFRQYSLREAAKVLYLIPLLFLSITFTIHAITYSVVYIVFWHRFRKNVST